MASGPHTPAAGTSPGEIRFEFPADLSYLSIVRRLVGKAAARCGFAEPAVREIQMAADEACTNAIQHACCDPSDRIEVRIHPRDWGIQIDVADRGPGFPFHERLKDNLVEIIRRMPSRGFGIPIIGRLMDEARYEPAAGGNVLRMTRQLDRATHAQHA